MKFALRLAGALALLCGVALIIFGLFVYFRSPSGSDIETLFDALDAIAIGAFGALLGAGLIIRAGRASKRDA